MAHKIRRATHTHPGQTSLFDEHGAVIVPQPAILHPGEIEVGSRERLRTMLDGFDRAEVAAKVSDLVGWRVSAEMLYAYTAQSRTANRLPQTVTIAVERVTGSTLITDWTLEIQGARAIRGEQVLIYRLGEIASESRLLRDYLDGRAH